MVDLKISTSLEREVKRKLKSFFFPLNHKKSESVRPFTGFFWFRQTKVKHWGLMSRVKSLTLFWRMLQERFERKYWKWLPWTEIRQTDEILSLFLTSSTNYCPQWLYDCCFRLLHGRGRQQRLKKVAKLYRSDWNIDHFGSSGMKTRNSSQTGSYDPVGWQEFIVVVKSWRMLKTFWTLKL